MAKTRNRKSFVGVKIVYYVMKAYLIEKNYFGICFMSKIFVEDH